MVRSIASILALTLLAAALSGCVTLPDPEASQDVRSHVVATVGEGGSAGQTFVARRPRLNGIELWLASPAPEPGGELLAELFHGPEEIEPLASLRFSLEAVSNGAPMRLAFPPQDDPPGQGYYLQLRASGVAVDVLGRDEDAYPQGQAWLDGHPLDADLAFRLFYDYDAAAMLGDLLDLLPRAWLVLPLAALLLLPGWLLLDLSGLRLRLDGGEQVALAAGLSAALTPLLLLWTSTAGLCWSRPAVIAGAALLSAAAACRLLRRFRPGQQSPISNLQSPIPSPQSPAWPLLGIFALSLAVRLAMVRDLAAPAWVDSVHHVLVAQLIVDGGALPASYETFVSVGTASYHAGFQSLVAAFHWLSGLDVAGAMLLLGQVLNALMIFAAYLFARELTGERGAGLVAALVVGLFSPMPAYYASWGRYTQLAGLLILPAALALARRSLLVGETSPLPQPLPQGRGDSPSPWGERVGVRGKSVLSLLLAALTLAGLILTHYRVAAFYLCFLAAYLVAERWPGSKSRRQWAGDSLRLAAVGGTATILALPWLVPALTTFWLPKLTALTAAPPASYRDFAWHYLTAGLGAGVLILAALGLAWALVQRQRFALTLVLWMALLFLLASLGSWGLPGAGFVDYTSVEITLFLPLSVLVGYLASRVLAAWREALPPRWMPAYRGAVVVLGAGLALFGALTLLPILNPDTVLLRQADRPALAWLRENTPTDALVLINPLAWSPHLYAGRDGGYWIAPLAGRRTLPPNALYGLGTSEQIAPVNELCTVVSKQGDDPDALWPLLREWSVSHVYLGARGGPLSARALSESKHYRLAYARDGAWVFEVLPQSP